MKTSKFYLTIVSLIALLVSNAVAAAWTGSMSEPENMKKIDGKAFYVITTADELAWFADQVNGGKTTINAVLGNDIVFGKDNNTKCSVKWTPIGKDTGHQFAGILDGAGYTIYGIYVNGIPIAGIVGVLKTGGVVRNLRTNSGYIGGGYRVGGFVAHNDGLIQSVENNNNIEVSYISGDSTSIYIGGIAGHNNGSITTSSNKASVSNKAPTALSGGVAGKNSGIIENSGNSGSVGAVSQSAGSDAICSGGIAGYNIGSINRTKNVGAISANGSYAYSAGSSGANNNNCSYEGFDSMGLIHYSCTGYRKTYVGGIVGLSTTIISNSINNGSFKISSSKKTNAYSNGIVASGKAKNSIDLRTLKYWLDETEFQGTSENMQKDQFAWILNTTNGTETNSGMWTRTTGYPDFAKDSNLAIYRVVFNDDGATSNRYTNYKGLVTFPENPEPAEGYIFTGWYNADDIKVKPTTVFTADQTVKAVYTDASDVFWTINFYNAAPADTILETKSYQHGNIVTYGGVEPTLATTAKYTYKFKGWDVEPTNAVEDFDYHAVYDSTIRSYKILFNDFDGKLVESATIEYGKMPSCSKTPTRAATAKWKYAHKGWKPALDYVTEETSYTAIYDSVKVEYKVTFMNGVDVIDEQMVPYGDAAVAPANVTREGYKFIGWNTSFAKITGDLTVKALFEELVIHTVNVFDGDGKKIDDKKVEDGEKYTLPEAPKKDGYTFDGWYNVEGKVVGYPGDKITVTDNITLKAKYTAINYAITFADEKGSKISSVEVAYGQMPTAPKDPTKASTAQYTYTFKGWSPTLASVTGAATYTAIFDSTLRKYTITFKNGTTALQTSDVAYGSKPSYTGSTPTKSSTDRYAYTFKGWNPSIETVTGTAIYTAVFDSTLRKYTVTFKNGTTTMQTSDVAYGAKPSYTGSTPTKSSTDKYSYTFKGWSPTLASVTGAATYTAIFDSTLRKYTITFKNGTATLQTSDVAYGVKPSYTGSAPTKKATDTYTYEVKGWNPVIAAVTKAATYQAVFDSSKVTGIIEGRLASSGVAVRVVSRSVQISAAPKNSTYAILDIQGRVLLSGRVESENFNIAMSRTGSYLVRVGNATRKVQVK